MILKTKIKCTVLISFFLAGCALLNTPQEPKYTPAFDFTPPTRSSSRSAGITVALISPQFMEIMKHREFLLAPYSMFATNMASDFEEMVTAKGISIRGPFKNRDEMVYGDKRNSSLAIEVKIELNQDRPIQYRAYTSSASNSRYYKIVGGFSYYGNLLLTATHPMTGEKYWKKSVSLPMKQISLVSRLRFIDPPTLTDALSDVGVYNPIAQALESYYKEALETAWRHIDVDEFRAIAKEIGNVPLGANSTIQNEERVNSSSRNNVTDESVSNSNATSKKQPVSCYSCSGKGHFENSCNDNNCNNGIINGTCSTCNGDYKSGISACFACDGGGCSYCDYDGKSCSDCKKGVVKQKHNLCSGTGKIKKSCVRCNGTGKVTQ